MRILVTGGAGFIGSHLVDGLGARGHEMAVIDNYATGQPENLAEPSGSLTLFEDSIARTEKVDSAMERFEPEVVVHCAASYKDPGDWLEDALTNVVGTANILKAAARVGVRRLVYFQTALCYGTNPQQQPITLGHPVAPEGSYAITKTAGEQFVAQAGLDFISFRLANVYGPRNFSGPIPTFYRRLSAGEPCFVVNTRRDFVFIDDLIDIAVRAVKGEGSRGIYHVSSGIDHSIREVYEAVAAAMGVQQPVEERERAPDDAATILLDPAQTREEFGWAPVHALADGVARTVDWYRTHGVGETYTHLQQRG